MISARQFSLHLAKKFGESSSIEIGGYNESMLENLNFEREDLEGKHLDDWRISLKNIEVDQSEAEINIPAILDSSTQLIHMNWSKFFSLILLAQFSVIRDYIQKKRMCGILENQIFYCFMSAQSAIKDFPRILFKFKHFEVQLEPEDYLYIVFLFLFALNRPKTSKDS